MQNFDLTGLVYLLAHTESIIASLENSACDQNSPLFPFLLKEDNQPDSTLLYAILGLLRDRTINNTTTTTIIIVLHQATPSSGQTANFCVVSSYHLGQQRRQAPDYCSLSPTSHRQRQLSFVCLVLIGSHLNIR